MSAGPLFDFAHAQALVRRTDPDTSRQAAARVNVNRLERLVLAALREHGPLTTTEIEARTGVKLISVSPRMVKLEEKLLVVRTEEKREKRIVWRAA